MQRVQLSDSLSLSRMIHGEWRLSDWSVRKSELTGFIEEITALGITSFDHADIYGDYTCEAIFGEAIKGNSALRDSIEIITKCGIKLISDKNPGQTIPYYDQSYDHIIRSVERSLNNLSTDRIDLLLIHRPSPLMDPVEIARAFEKLKQEGKVRNFGVSNFTPIEFDTLNSFCDNALVTNQIEISPYCLEHFNNHNIQHLQKLDIKPMVWSPLAGGKLFSPDDDKAVRVSEMLKSIANELGIKGIDKVAYAWLLMHPAGFMPIVGSGRLDRIGAAAEAIEIKMTSEQWFRVYTASLGANVP